MSGVISWDQCEKSQWKRVTGVNGNGKTLGEVAGHLSREQVLEKFPNATNYIHSFEIPVESELNALPAGKQHFIYEVCLNTHL